MWLTEKKWANVKRWEKWNKTGFDISWKKKTSKIEKTVLIAQKLNLQIEKIFLVGLGSQVAMQTNTQFMLDFYNYSGQDRGPGFESWQQ